MLQPLSSQHIELSSLKSNEPILLCASDNNYVKSMTVTLHSAAQHLGDGAHLHAIVLDGGISESNWVAIKESLATLPISVYTIRPDLEQVHDLGISHHITHTAYLRLLAGRLLPHTIDRAIYFDSDLLIQDDICKLWQLELGDDYALAVPDIACPFVDARHAECNFRKASPYFSALSPIRNWKQLGLDPSAYYFNSGMMVLNLKRMREESIEQQLLQCLRDNQKYVWCWDQYALNVVFAQQWKPLPLNWNAGAHLFEFPDESFSPFHVDDFRQAIKRPSIIHYTTEWKPWDYQNNHPLRELFFQQLDQTAFAGWRPNRPEINFRKSWDAFWAEVIKQSYIRYQALSAGLRNAPELPASQLPLISIAETLADANSIVASAELASPEFMLTIFSIPKPFAGIDDLLQRNAINSWKRLVGGDHVVLVGNPAVACIATELGVRSVTGIATNERGTPLVNSAFQLVRAHSDTPYLVYTNCDMILFEEFKSAVELLTHRPDFERFFATTRRINLAVDRMFDFGDEGEIAALKQSAASNGWVESLVCKDVMVFPRDLFESIPDFAVGRGNWDNWMILRAKQLGVPVVRMTADIPTIHQAHNYSDDVSNSRFRCYVSSEEARENQRLAGGRNLIVGSTSDYKLGRDGLKPCRYKWLHGEFWHDFPRFTGLLMQMAGWGHRN